MPWWQLEPGHLQPSWWHIPVGAYQECSCITWLCHDMETFFRHYWPFVKGIYQYTECYCCVKMNMEVAEKPLGCITLDLSRFISEIFDLSPIVPCAIVTHWGWVTYICVGNLATFGLDNGLSPGWCQAIIWSNAGILLIEPLRMKFREIFITIITFSFMKMFLKVSSIKWQSFCISLNVLDIYDHFRKVIRCRDVVMKLFQWRWIIIMSWHLHEWSLCFTWNIMYYHQKMWLTFTDVMCQ